MFNHKLTFFQEVEKDSETNVITLCNINTKGFKIDTQQKFRFCCDNYKILCFKNKKYIGTLDEKENK